MILKKPYAFLVKYFKLIHGIILAGAIFILFKFHNIVDFFNTYISNNQRITGADEISSKYIDWTISFSLVFVLVITGVIMALMIYKKKPKFFYIYTIVVYTFGLFSIFYLSGFLYDIQFETPSLRLTKIIRDIIYTFNVLQIPIILTTFIRTIGFDVKKFDFKKDLMDLGIEEGDNEEFALDIKLDSEDIKARIRKRIRYIGYAFKENKVMFMCVGGAVGLVLALLLIMNITSREKIYKEGQKFKTNKLQIEVLDSYKTNADAVGEALSSKNFYLIVKLRYKNISNEALTIYTDNALVSYDGLASVTPTLKMSRILNEFGVNYYTQQLDPGETRDFVLIYEIKNEYYKSDLRLKYLYDSKVTNGKLEYKYRTVKLSPKTFSNDKKTVDTKNLGEYISFDGSLLGKTKLRINEIKIADTFFYNTVRCQKGGCTSLVKSIKASTTTNFEMTLMRIDYDVIYDYDTLGQGYVNNDIISKYGSIRFVINDKEYNNRVELTNVTPYITGKYVFIEVREKLKGADKIYLDLTIRGKVYTIVIKDTPKEEPEENDTEDNTEENKEAKE